MVRQINLVETIQNYLPVVPSPIVQETFKQTTYNKINTLDLARVFYHIDVFLGIVLNISRLLRDSLKEPVKIEKNKTGKV